MSRTAGTLTPTLSPRGEGERVGVASSSPARQRAGVRAALHIILAAILVWTMGAGFLAAPAARAQSLAAGYGPPAPAPATPAFLPDQILVRFRGSVGPERSERLLAGHGLSRIRRIKALDIHVLGLPSGLTVQRALELFKSNPDIEFAEPNYLVRLAEVNDPGMGLNQWAPQKIAAPQAWATTEGDPAVIIAVVDTGIDYRHPELSPNAWSNSGEVPANGLDDDGNGYVDDTNGWDFVNSDGQPLDDHFHGTHVAGIAAAAPTGDPAGVVGVCPRCRLMAVKVMDASGSGSMDNVAEGITYAADNGARAINLSLGSYATSETLQAAVDYAWSRGAVVVAAAGNDGTATKLYPAAYSNAIAVASTNADDYHSCFSNFGEGYVSVSAPGELIYSTTPLDASGSATYGTYSGTSMATPHVAGLAGLLFAQDLARSNTTVRTLIETTTEDLGPVGGDAHFGSGRINAYRAVQGDTSATAPPEGLFSDDLFASGYPNARKIVRDASGFLHLVWHARSGGQYRVLYASGSDGIAWNPTQVIFASSAETYNPTVATDGTTLYVAFPSKDGSSRYRVFFASRTLPAGTWTQPVAVMGGDYHAVRPHLHLDPSNGRLHLVASSYDDTRYVYYAASSDGGLTWGAVRQVDLATGDGQFTRYASVHANGSRVYIMARTIERAFFGLLSYFRLMTVRSLDDGATWGDLIEQARSSGTDHGASLTGSGDRLYLSYEQSGSVHVRRSDDGATWTSAENLGMGDWPSVTQGDDGQAWVMWESSGSLMLRRYTGYFWDPAETVFAGSILCKGHYPNLKPGTSSSLVEWVATNCSGAPYRLMYGSRDLGSMPTIPSVQFATANYVVDESAGTAMITVTMSMVTSRPVTVTYSTSDGSASAGRDYSTANGTLVFAPGETSRAFSVAIREDTTDEPDETVTLTLSNAKNALLGTPSLATLTIQDNDLPPAVSFSSGNSYVNENVGVASVGVRLSAASAHTVTVDYATSGGTASAGSDYAARNGVLTFAPGETNKSFAVPIIDDTLPEGSETVGLALSNPTNAVLGTPLTATLTINANDSVSLSGSYYYVHENAVTTTITVRLNAPSSQPVTVDYATSGGTATAGSDYLLTSGTLTFAPGETSKVFVVPIVDDALPEGNETVGLALSNPSNAGLGTPVTATLTIYASDALMFNMTYYYVNENAGSAAITVKLSGPSSLPVTVDYATGGGTATAGSDYMLTSGILTFAPGETIKTFAVPIIDDALPEASETVGLTLSNPSNAALGSPSTATLSINANDALSFSSSNYYVNENVITTTVLVRLSGPSSQTVTVDYATGDGTAIAGSDYAPASGTLIFAPGETSKSFIVSIADDALPEVAETIRVALSNPSNASLGTPYTATLTINASDSVSFSGSYYYVNENAGTFSALVRLSGPSSQTVSVDYATSDGTATAGSDYTAASGTLTFAPGETSKSFTVLITDDILPEGAETVRLTLSNAVNAGLGAPYTTTLTINANDSVSFSGSYYYVSETAGSIAITVRLSGPSSHTVTVDYATSDGTATAGSDYTAGSGTLSFAPGETAKTFSVVIIDDSLREASETIRLTLSNPVNAGLGTPVTATLTINASD